MAKCIQHINFDGLNGTTHLKNTVFVYEWKVENLGQFLERKYEIPSPIFCTNLKDGTEWKLVLFERHQYPRGSYFVVNLVKVSNDVNPIGVKYSISIVSPKDVQLMQTKEKVFRKRWDLDECEIRSEIAGNKLLVDNSLVIRCEMDIVCVEMLNDTRPEIEADSRELCSSPNMNTASSHNKVINIDKFSDSYNIVDDESDDTVQSPEMSTMEKDSLKALLADFESLFTRKLFSDVTLVCAGTPITAHKAVLSARSDYFKRICSQKADSRGEIIISDVNSSVMEAVLYYMYTGKVRCLNVDFALDLYSASKKFNLLKLQGLLLDFLKSSITVKNVTEILQVSENLNLSDLKYACLAFANSNKSEVVQSEKWNWLIKNNPHVAGEVLLTIASFQKTNIL